MTETLNHVGGTLGLITKILDKHTNENSSIMMKAQQIQLKLYSKFEKELSEYPSLNGSVVRGTSIAGSDIDIQIKFKRKAGNIEEVRSKVEKFLFSDLKMTKLKDIRSQNHSVGLLFDINGEEKRIDIVPMREIENGKGDTFLYSSKSETRKKTNSRKQSTILVFTKKQKKLIRLLKDWKLSNGIKILSTYVEHIVLRAYKEIKIPKGIDNALLALINYIGEKITTMRIVDPANTNNVISDSLSRGDKESIRDFCYEMIEAVKRDKRNILDYFDHN